MKVDTAFLRQFIIESFSTDELTEFLFDYFRAVYNDVGSTMTNTHRIQLLLEYCVRHNQYIDLFAALDRERPGAFQQHDFTNVPQPEKAKPKPGMTLIKRNPRQIFISHAHQDAELAKKLAADLSIQNWAVWIAPDSIQPGEKWVEAINRGLAESGKILLLLTPDAAASTYVRDETNAAIEYRRHGEPIEVLPLDVKPVAPTDLPFTWVSIQKTPFSEKYKDGLEMLLFVLQPEVMSGLMLLYDQLRQEIDQSNWETAQIVGLEILAQYPDFRETVHLMNFAKRKAKQEAILQSEAERLYMQLRSAITQDAWEDALKLISQIQSLINNYKDIDRLSKIVERKQQQKGLKLGMLAERMKGLSVWKRINLMLLLL